jgi:septum formation protein
MCSSGVMYQLVLASASPRRRQLLKEAGFSCLVQPSQVSEKLEKNMTLDQQLLELSRRKARAVFESYKHIHLDPFLLLAADTEVVMNDSPLGKPESNSQAFAFLKILSNATHHVKTAFTFINSKTFEEVSHLETTEIIFRDLTDHEILDYVSTNEGLDKAGGYGIQGPAAKFVKEIKGSWTNVVGLPMEALLQTLKEKNWEIKGS